MVDAIIQEWEHQLPLLVADLLYYADDGRLAGYCVKELQHGLDVLVDLFGRMGLKFNVAKTKVMISVGRMPPRPLGSEAYK